MLEKKVIEISNTLYQKHATIYADSSAVPRACILYFHGGGLLYGERDDLPKLHIDTLTGAGYIIISYDYPLAPAAKLNTILDDVSSSISHYVEYSDMYCGCELPFFLWGRSAGAYLCLLAAAQGDLPTAPKGILSYYGYGFLCDGWFDTPSSFYCSLPPVEASCLDNAGTELRAWKSGHALQHLCLCKADRAVAGAALRRAREILLSGLYPAYMHLPAMSAVLCTQHERSRCTVRRIPGANRPICGKAVYRSRQHPRFRPGRGRSVYGKSSRRDAEVSRRSPGYVKHKLVTT